MAGFFVTNIGVCQTTETANDAIAPTKVIPNYRFTPGVYGTITSVGSDTLANLLAIWAQRFQEMYPHVKFQIQASGSATASQALTEGSAGIGPMSRQLTSQEIANFTNVHGYQPTAIIVAIDAIAIYAEKNNPIAQLTLREVDALFSATRLCGAKQAITQWQQLGISKFGEQRKIQLFGRNSASGTYDLFKQKALCNGDYLRSVNEMPSSSSVVQSIASSVGALGYAALGYKDPNVKTLSLSDDSGQFYKPTPENLSAGDYPFTRYLYIVVNKPPGQALATLEQTFLRFILSDEGQTIVEENGYFGVSKRIIARQLAQLETEMTPLEVIP
jgi:phosphate transport system substrate-binding protein